MENNSKAVLLRVFIGSTDTYKQEPLYEWIVFQAKESGIAGATVFKGILGFGASSVIHSHKFWEATEKLPVVIEIVDEEAHISRFYETIRPILETMPNGCLVTREEVEVWLYKPGQKRMFG